MTPETRYARTGDLHIAYQVVGDGPVDIVFVPEFWHTIEVQWDQPELAAFLERLASFGRLISFARLSRAPEVDTAGDGFLATFDGPTRAVRRACVVLDAVHELGIEIRAGLHTGEVEVLGDGLAGSPCTSSARARDGRSERGARLEHRA